MSETRHYRHPERPINTHDVQATTKYGSQRPILTLTGPPDALKRLEKAHGLVRIYPMGYRTF